MGLIKNVIVLFIQTMGHLASDNQNEKFEEEDNDLQYASISIKPKTNPKR